MKYQETTEFDLFLSEEYLHRPRQLLSGAFTYLLPEIRKQYQFLAASPNAAKTLKLDLESELDDANKTYFKEIVSGAHVVPDFFPYSQAYAGYQFGQFAGQLGDGRVVNLFQIEGEDGKRYEIQLKGSGKTAFSRFADGKAVIRSSIREFVISEYLHAIGIPSTRSLALTNLPKTYAARTGPTSCAVVARFAESWVRVGTFDLYRARGDRKGLRQIADYTINEVFGEDQLGSFGSLGEEATKYDRLYREIVVRNARTTALCQVYGFLNGVLNTDNTSVLGLCLDFGPFAMMDKFDPSYTPNSEDPQKRYGYDNVPSSVWWNLTRLGEALGELLGNKGLELPEKITPELEGQIISRANKVIDAAAEEYQNEFMKTYTEAFRRRLGLRQEFEDDDDKIISPMLKMLWETEIHYNQFFAILAEIKEFDDYKALARRFVPEGFRHSRLVDREDLEEKIADFLQTYDERLFKEKATFESRCEISKGKNPLFVPSNWVIEEVVDELRDNRCSDVTSLDKLMKMSCYPFESDKWGPDSKDKEEKWLDREGYDETRYMTQCSCAS